MNRKTGFASIVWRAAAIVAFAVGLIPLSPTTALAMTRHAEAAAPAPASTSAANACASQPTLQPSALLSTFVTTTLPLIPAGTPAAPRLAPLLAPAASASVPPSQIPLELGQSIMAMRALPKIDLRWQATFLAPIGSGWLTLTLPDAVDGQGTLASTSWRVATSGGQTAVQVGDSPAGNLPSSGLATALRDAVVDLPCSVPDATVRRAGDVDLLEGRLAPGGGSDLLRQVTGLVVPGRPIGELSLAIDPSTKTWRALDLRLVWSVVDVNVLGHQITWGPTGRVSLAFGDATTQPAASSTPLEQLSPSAAQLALNWLAQTPALSRFAGPVGVAFSFLDARQLRAM
ncbi:MAG TPA: hypothetical protein VNL16_06325, partial [Chloroflexota bacterium]|nr:hypothetical protein [Chloroflexota bacterium]